jgi:hypothetical protein
MNHHPDQGAMVNRTARRPFLRRSGSFASLRGGGSGAGSLGGGGTAVLRLAGLLALTTALALAPAASSASAAITRQLQTQITEADGVPFAEPTGLAADSAEILWVADQGDPA